MFLLVIRLIFKDDQFCVISIVHRRGIFLYTFCTSILAHWSARSYGYSGNVCPHILCCILCSCISIFGRGCPSECSDQSFEWNPCHIFYNKICDPSVCCCVTQARSWSEMISGHLSHWYALNALNTLHSFGINSILTIFTCTQRTRSLHLTFLALFKALKRRTVWKSVN